MRWLIAFLFTELIEVPIYVFALRGGPPALPRVPRVAVAFGASALTHPIVWFVFPAIFGRGHYVPMVVAAEAFAVLAEAYWFSVFGLRRPLVWALCANAASLGIGLALRSQFGWP